MFLCLFFNLAPLHKRYRQPHKVWLHRNIHMQYLLPQNQTDSKGTLSFNQCSCSFCGMFCVPVCELLFPLYPHFTSTCITVNLHFYWWGQFPLLVTRVKVRVTVIYESASSPCAAKGFQEKRKTNIFVFSSIFSLNFFLFLPLFYKGVKVIKERNQWRNWLEWLDLVRAQLWSELKNLSSITASILAPDYRTLLWVYNEVIQYSSSFVSISPVKSNKLQGSLNVNQTGNFSTRTFHVKTLFQKTAKPFKRFLKIAQRAALI